ncbi:MAG: SulP family inorganic anion transporter [Deinococcota bacterium]|jgi:SulP family sulfate permease|nr:SulP family inorganic anion transporter [Deinococcota bacterium]
MAQAKTLPHSPSGLGSHLGDVVAGLSVAIILIPQALAYAELAGMPAYTGLYAAALPPLAAAFFASSPYLQTGPVALSALLTFAALSPLATPGSPDYLALGALLALIVGVVRVLLGAFGLGIVAYLMSQPVLMAFSSAAGIVILASQLPAALGVMPPSQDLLAGALWAVANPLSWQPGALLITTFTLVLMHFGSRFHPLFPAIPLSIAFAMLYVTLLDYRGPVVGAVPPGLPPFTLSFPWEAVPELLLPGLVIALVGFAEAASIGRTYAAQERKPWSADKEFVSQGVANLAAALSGAFPVGGSFSRSALVRSAGAKTRWSGAVTGLAVLLFLPFAGVISSLPKAVLGALVIGGILGLIRLRELMRLRRYSKPQFALAWTTVAATLLFAPHIERALLLGVALAIGVHLWRETRFTVRDWNEGKTLHFKPQGVLWFGSTHLLEETFVRLLAAHPEAERLVIHLDGLGRTDLTGTLALRALLRDARKAGLRVDLQDIPPQSYKVVSRVMDWDR